MCQELRGGRLVLSSPAGEVAKVLELSDRLIYDAAGVVSGHTLKHLVASLGALWIVLMLRQQRQATSSPAVSYS